MAAEQPTHTNSINHTNHTDHIHMPDPSIWPFVISLGTGVLFGGIGTITWFSTWGTILLVIGLLTLLGGIGGWIYEDIDLERRSE